LLIAALFTPSRSLFVPHGRSLPVVLDATHNLEAGMYSTAALPPSKSYYGSAIIKPAIHGLGPMAVAASFSQRELFLLAAFE